MRTFWFTLSIIQLLATAFAYNIAGGYERMMDWYAHQIDISINGGTAQRIAPKCLTNGKPCNFNEFIKYITPDTDLKQVPSISSEAYPDVDATAKALLASDLTKTYVLGRIANKSKTAADVIKKVTEFVQGKVDSGKLPADDPSLTAYAVTLNFN